MIPVFCTIEPETELINDFLTETYDGYSEAGQFLVIITTTDWSQFDRDEAELSPEEARSQRSKVITHSHGPMKVPSRPPWTEHFESPFIGKTPEAIAIYLREANSAPRHLCRTYCAILDAQSKEDRTVLLVKTERDEGDNLPPELTIVQIRESFKEANGLLQSVSVGVASLAETLWNKSSSRK